MTHEKVFAQRMALVRRKQGLSQLALSIRTGLKPSAISHFETGRRAPSLKNIVVICIALQASADFLLGTGIGPMKNQPRASAPKWKSIT